MTDVRFFPYEIFSPSENMAIDEYFLKYGTGVEIRLYGWNPPAVSIGHSQLLRQVVALPFCEKKGIPIIRRHTGGGAVFHKNDITYMVSAPISVFKDSSVVGIYKEISGILLNALKKCGIPCHFAGTVSREERRNGMKQGVACFLLPSDYEILAANRKLVGSAQHRDTERILQHGSIAWRFDYKQTAACLGSVSETLEERVASIDRFVPDLSIETFQGRVLETLEEAHFRVSTFTSVFSVVNREKVIELMEAFPVQ